MQECPKCSSRYGDDVKLCRTCGAILEAVAEKSPQATASLPHDEDDAHEAALSNGPAWSCSQCGESVPGGFEVCWNCGTSQNGATDPGFSKEPANYQPPDESQPAEPAAAAKQPDRHCPRCGSPKIIPNTVILDQAYSHGPLHVVVDAKPDALIFKDRLYDQLAADICADCGHVELTVAHPGDLYEHYLRARAEQNRE
jgi:hypothetical protein